MNAAFSASWTVALSIAVVFSVHCLVVGEAALRLVARWTNTPFDAPNAVLRGFLAISAGFAANLAALCILGLLGLLVWQWVLLVGAVFFAAMALQPHTTQMSWMPIRFSPPSRLWLCASLVLALFVLVVWPSNVAPGHWDDTMYHLPLARFYVESHGIALAPYLRFPLFPQHMHLLLALGLMLGGEPTAQMFANLPLFFLAVGMLGCSLWLTGSLFWGVLASLLLLFASPIKSTWGYAYIDNGLALCCWAAAVAMALALAPCQHVAARACLPWVIVAAWLASAAASIKLFGAVFAVCLAVPLWWYLRVGRTAKVLCSYAGIVVVIGSVWYVRSYWISGDPLHPLGGKLFGYFLWDAADLVGQYDEQEYRGVGRAPWLFFRALKAAGVQWWALAVVGLLGIRRVPPSIGSMQIGFAIYVLFWFFGTQVNRYLAPVFGPAAFLSALTLATGVRRVWIFLPGRIARQWRPVYGDVLAVGLVVSALLVIVPAGNERARHRADMLASRSGYSLMAEANRLAPTWGHRVVQLGFENAIYFFDGTAIGDWFGPGRYREMLNCELTPCKLADPAVLQAALLKFDSRMLVVNTRRFSIDLPAYQSIFELVYRTPDGVLLILK